MDISYLLEYRAKVGNIRSLAELIAITCHSGQTYGSSNHPYFLHPLRVADRVRDMGYRVINVHKAVNVALLHDTLEDSSLTYEELERLVGSDLAEKVEKLTRRPGVAYFDYIRYVGTWTYPRIVKIADLEDNLVHSRLSGLSADHIERYQFALNYLRAESRDNWSTDMQ